MSRSKSKSSARSKSRKSRSSSSASNANSTNASGIEFHCNFESGNIGRIEPINDYEYDMYIRPDSNNPNYRLWFYFSVTNTKKHQRVLFNICNFSKTKSLYRHGMTPLVRSTSRNYWERIPEKQCYYYRCPKHNKNYVLSFLFVFDRDDETFQFAYCYPYTYSDLQKFLLYIRAKEFPFVKQELLCRTILHRRLDLLTITNPESETPANQKKMVFFTARVHPGETPASFICHGLISFLISSHPLAQILRDHVIFKIVPMLNPDGVFLGNYRCSSVGNDLNRHWLNPAEWAHPEICALRNILLELKADPDVNMDVFIDIHSHSTGTSSFMYVNSIEGSSDSQQLLFPKLLSAKTNLFSYSSSKVCKDVNKLGSGRRALGELLQIARCCYTLEASFFCYAGSNGKTVPFTEETYLELGKYVGMTFVDYYKLPNPFKKRKSNH